MVSVSSSDVFSRMAYGFSSCSMTTSISRLLLSSMDFRAARRPQIRQTPMPRNIIAQAAVVIHIRRLVFPLFFMADRRSPFAFPPFFDGLTHSDILFYVSCLRDMI